MMIVSFVLGLLAVLSPAMLQAETCARITGKLSPESSELRLLPGSGAECLARALTTCKKASADVYIGKQRLAKIRLYPDGEDCRLTLTRDDGRYDCSIEGLTALDGFSGRKAELEAAGRQKGRAAIKLVEVFGQTVAAGDADTLARLDCGQKPPLAEETAATELEEPAPPTIFNQAYPDVRP